MGCYVNPNGQTKEDFLSQNGREVSQNELRIDDVEVPVILVDNGPFTAAAVAFDARELRVFLDPRDYRSKRFYMVAREALYKVSDLKRYE